MLEELVGETVRIRTYDDLAEEFGTDSRGCVLVPELPMYVGMCDELCGKDIKIISVNHNTGHLHTEKTWVINPVVIEEINATSEELDSFLNEFFNLTM